MNGVAQYVVSSTLRTVVGRGERLFQDGLPTIPLTVAGSQMFGSGVHRVAYAAGAPLQKDEGGKDV